MHGSDADQRATAVSLVLGALGCGALLLALGLIGFSATTGEALGRGGPALAAVIAFWAAAAWVELWRRAAASGRPRRRGSMVARALAAACVALASPVVSIAVAGALPVPSGLSLAAGLALLALTGALPLRRLLTP